MCAFAEPLSTVLEAFSVAENGQKISFREAEEALSHFPFLPLLLRGKEGGVGAAIAAVASLSFPHSQALLLRKADCLLAT